MTMAPLTLEIFSSIIYPKRATPFSSDSITIDITPPSPTLSQPSSSSPPCGPENPLYRLPQSVSSGGLKIHLNAFVAPARSPASQAKNDVNRHSHTSRIDRNHVLYEISKTPVGADYALTCFRHGKNSGGYGRCKMSFTKGWLSGGVWDIEHVGKAPGELKENRLELTVDEGGNEDGVWKMKLPVEVVVAREKPQPQGEFGENGKSIEILEEGLSGLEGWTEEGWRDFLTACWITKVWYEGTRTPWLGASARSGEASMLGRW
ncbi:hypothetical protein RUND412_010875 [Rhizina undulata]